MAHRILLAGILWLLACLAIVTDAEAATTWSPSQPESGYIEGMGVRACSTNGMATSPVPTVTPPTGPVQTPVRDSDGCVSFVMSLPGLWRLSYTTAGVPPAAVTSVITAAPLPPAPDTSLEDGLLSFAAWLAVVAVSRFLQQAPIRLALTTLGFAVILFTATPEWFPVLATAQAALFVYDSWLVITGDPS